MITRDDALEVIGSNVRPLPDLRGADLSGADLRGADLRGADLRRAWVLVGNREMKIP